MGTFEKYCDSRKKLIDRSLKAHMGAFFPFGILREAAQHALFPGGKRIRPLLAMAIGEGLGAKSRPLLDFACALELIHNYTLIHDDLPAMDDDDFRRGKPTVHKKYGEACAILTGDALLTHAFELLAGCRPEIGRLVARSIGGRGVILGQALDLGLGGGKKNDTRSLNKINQLKTACLFEASIVGAAFCSSKGAQAAALLRSFGVLFGECFQIADDLADAKEEKKKNVQTLATRGKTKELEARLRNLERKLERKAVALPLKKPYPSILLSLVRKLYLTP
ncbi:MAG: polyprenyl synthetase family protein [Elusimicrobia bacterium]|nr:polyprenyl synthetase family protein [Elusimicrobiota bacterium]